MALIEAMKIAQVEADIIYDVTKEQSKDSKWKENSTERITCTDQKHPTGFP